MTHRSGTRTQPPTPTCHTWPTLEIL
jgi:hypothetical protein